MEPVKKPSALEWARQKAEEAKAKLAAPVAANIVVMLPRWAELARGVPNAALRSALFGAIKKGARTLMEREEIHAQDGISIVYTGARLDQGDLDVWEMVLHMARLQALGTAFRVTAYQMLKLLEKTDTTPNRDTLARRLSRLKATALDVSVGRYGYEGSLIDEVYRDKETLEYVIQLNPKLSALFEADQFTMVDFAVRRDLDGHQLAQWLHGYYASHAKPYPVKVETLLKLSGGANSEPRSANQKLRKALNAVEEASVANGEKFSYEIIGDLVHVTKIGSKTQRKHLRKKQPQKSIKGIK